MSKMNMFVDKWKNTTDCYGISVFTPQTIESIENLKRHVLGGCISDIPPGGGTNRNERFHHHINSIFCRSKVGILLAYALLTVVIHAYNSSENKHSRLATQPITASKFRRHHVADNLLPVGIIPKVRQSICSSDHFEIDVSDCVIDLEMVAMVYTESLKKLQVLRSVATMGLSRLFRSSPFSTSSLHAHDSSSQLRQTLHDNGLQFTLVHGDGNCFFTAIAINMSSNPNQRTQSLHMSGWSSGSEIIVYE